MFFRGERSLLQNFVQGDSSFMRKCSFLASGAGFFSSFSASSHIVCDLRENSAAFTGVFSREGLETGFF